MNKYVRTVTRHTGCSGFVSVTLPAMPTEPGARPWAPPLKSEPDERAAMIAEECLAALRAAQGPQRSTAIAKTIRRRKQNADHALVSLLAAGLVTRQRETGVNYLAYLWSLASA